MTANLFVHHPNGLFPAPYPQDHTNIDRICKLFHFLGIFLAKCLQDNRLVDIPLSEPFHKLLCLGKSPTTRHLSRAISARSSSVDSDNLSPRSFESIDASSDCCFCYAELFTDCDFEMVFPELFSFVKQLRKLIKKRRSILNDVQLTAEEKRDSLDNLMFESEHGHECKLEDLGWVFLSIILSVKKPVSSSIFKIIILKKESAYHLGFFYWNAPSGYTSLICKTRSVFNER